MNPKRAPSKRKAPPKAPPKPRGKPPKKVPPAKAHVAAVRAKLTEALAILDLLERDPTVPLAKRERVALARVRTEHHAHEAVAAHAHAHALKRSATTPATRAAARKAETAARAAGRAAERAAAALVKARERAEADQAKARAKLQAAADREHARAEKERAKLEAKEARAAARKSAKQAKKQHGHPVEGCGLSYEDFKPLDRHAFADTATALNYQRARRGGFGKASSKQVQASLGRLKKSAYAHYQDECDAALQRLLSGESMPDVKPDPKEFQDDVPF